MLRTICKSKIHLATVTDANLRYEGSITIDEDLLDSAQILPYERVQVVNLNNGARLETYCLEGPRGSGTVCLNGAAARWAAPSWARFPSFLISVTVADFNGAADKRAKGRRQKAKGRTTSFEHFFKNRPFPKNMNFFPSK